MHKNQAKLPHKIPIMTLNNKITALIQIEATF